MGLDLTQGWDRRVEVSRSPWKRWQERGWGGSVLGTVHPRVQGSKNLRAPLKSGGENEEAPRGQG